MGNRGQGRLAHIRDAVAEEFFLREFLHEHDLRENKNTWHPGGIGCRYFDRGLIHITLLALKAQTPARHILASDNVVGEILIADTRLEIDFGADVLPAIFGAPRRFCCRLRRRRSFGCWWRGGFKGW